MRAEANHIPSNHPPSKAVFVRARARVASSSLFILPCDPQCSNVSNQSPLRTSMVRNQVIAPVVSVALMALLPSITSAADCNLNAFVDSLQQDPQAWSCYQAPGVDGFTGHGYLSKVYALHRGTPHIFVEAEDLAGYCANPNCAAATRALHAAFPTDCTLPDGKQLWADALVGVDCFSSSTPTTCGAGQSEVSVEGRDRVFCVNGMSCSGNKADGACPGVDVTYLPYGSQCALVRTGVYGCRAWADAAHTALVPNPDLLNCPADSAPVSVVSDKYYCVKQPVCVGKASTGSCPGKAQGLPKDATCTLLPTNAYGCTLA